MFRKLSVSAVALSLLTAPAMADETVDIDIIVQDIAVLSVTEASGQMIIDDTSDTTMGNPSSTGNSEGPANGNWAEVQLLTNYDVDAVRFTFPFTKDIRNDPVGNPNSTFNGTSFMWFGEAENADGKILGVFPKAGVVGSDGTIGGDVADKGFGQCVWGHDAANKGPLDVKGECRENGPNGLSNGVHNIAVGVATNWGNTPKTQPEIFAPAGTYTITMEATIVPEL